MKARSKSEIRNPKEVRFPAVERGDRVQPRAGVSVLGVRVSLGFRISSFGFPP